MKRTCVGVCVHMECVLNEGVWSVAEFICMLIFDQWGVCHCARYAV